jgi:hypothetical protein
MRVLSLTALALSLASSLVMADVRVEGPIEYGVFATQFKDPQPGERVLTRANQQIEQTEQVPAQLGTKFGVRYRLAGKTESGEPLTLMYFTPGLVGPDEAGSRRGTGRDGLRVHRTSRSGAGGVALHGVPGRSQTG